jgi:hypothetical protein
MLYLQRSTYIVVLCTGRCIPARLFPLPLHAEYTPLIRILIHNDSKGRSRQASPLKEGAAQGQVST